jgi:Uma2 family endonuclease
MSVVTIPQRRMLVPEFLEWAETQPEEARFELVDGEVVAMVGDTLRHNRTKLAVANCFQGGLEAAGSPCEVFIDGVGVQVGDDTLRIPDVAVQCVMDGQNPDSVILDRPIIVVEVTSRSSERSDNSIKVAEYFAVATIRHYLIVHPRKQLIIHHRRDDEGGIQVKIMHDGVLILDPPGISLPIASMFGAR